MDVSAFKMTESPKLIFKRGNSLIYYQQKSEAGKDAHEYDTPLIVKILREEQPCSRQIVQFNNQYEFTKDFTIKGIRKAYKRFKIADQYALLLEYDALELVHCDITKRPQPVHVRPPEILEVLSNIVMKLMAKNAPERYSILLTRTRNTASIIDTQMATNSGATGTSSTDALDHRF